MAHFRQRALVLASSLHCSNCQMSGKKLRLVCLVWPDDKPRLVDVELDNDKTVTALKGTTKTSVPMALLTSMPASWYSGSAPFPTTPIQRKL